MMAHGNFIDSSFLLAIPTELRLAIYDYCLADTNTITITAAPITVFGHHIKDRARRKPIPGLPLDLAPLARHTYDPSLLSISNPATISLDQGNDINTLSDALPYPAPLALLQSCRLIHNELADYMRGNRITRKPARGGLSLYVTYPYGVLVLKELYPNLLRQAKNVYVSGYYVSPPTSKKVEPRAMERKTMEMGIPGFTTGFWGGPMRGGSPPPPALPPVPLSYRQLHHQPSPKSALQPYPAKTALLAPLALASLTATLLPSSTVSIPLFQKLEARILYPGADSYSSVWSDDNGPIVQMLRNTCGGRIDMEVAKGRTGNAVIMKVGPCPRSRVVSTGWKRLGHERSETEGIVVGEHWGDDDDEM